MLTMVIQQLIPLTSIFLNVTAQDFILSPSLTLL